MDLFFAVTNAGVMNADLNKLIQNYEPISKFCQDLSANAQGQQNSMGFIVGVNQTEELDEETLEFKTSIPPAEILGNAVAVMRLDDGIETQQPKGFVGSVTRLPQAEITVPLAHFSLIPPFAANPQFAPQQHSEVSNDLTELKIEQSKDYRFHSNSSCNIEFPTLCAFASALSPVQGKRRTNPHTMNNVARVATPYQGDASLAFAVNFGQATVRREKYSEWTKQQATLLHLYVACPICGLGVALTKSSNGNKLELRPPADAHRAIWLHWLSHFETVTYQNVMYKIKFQSKKAFLVQ